MASEEGYPAAPDPAAEWTGARRRYDIVKEVTIAFGVVTLLAVLLSVLFSSPDVKPVTIAQWATAAPGDFVTTAVSELDGTSGLAGYGAPYTHVPGAGQNIIGGVSIQRALGVQIPIDPARAFVLDPLSIPAQSDAQLATALHTYESASTRRQQAWTTTYTKALAHASFSNGQIGLAPGRYGPVATMMQSLLDQAQSGGLDGALVSNTGFYQTDYTKPLLFLADGSYLGNLAQKQNLLGSQWGMMNETGNYPGQAWLWLYTFWYQVSPFSTSDNADAQIWAIMAVLSLALVCIPFLPGVRSVPRWSRIYRLVWRDYYRHADRVRPAPGSTATTP
ncbi:MAG TPA: hypothetical protein VMG74_00445 [Gaiellaceae bacterium]|nr:hypothetical protein [Gaiellaceae bacterium]